MPCSLNLLAPAHTPTVHPPGRALGHLSWVQTLLFAANKASRPSFLPFDNPLAPQQNTTAVPAGHKGSPVYTYLQYLRLLLSTAGQFGAELNSY